MNKDKKNIQIGEFAHQNKKMIIIVADPKDDTIFVSYNDRMVSGRIRDNKGDNIHILKDLLKHSAFDSGIDKFLMSIVDVMKINKLSIGVNNFLHFIDGALYNISKRHRENKKKEDGLIKSPITMQDLGRK